MKVEELIEELRKAPSRAEVMVPSEIAGGSVRVVGVEVVDEEWVDLILEE